MAATAPRSIQGKPPQVNVPALTSTLAALHATGNELSTAVATKQDQGDYATRSELRTGLATRQHKGSYATTEELAKGLAGKQGVGDYATTDQLESGLGTKQPKGDYALNATVAAELAARDLVMDSQHHDIEELASNLTGRVSQVEVMQEDLLKEVQAMDGSLGQVGDDVDTYSSALMMVNHELDTFRAEIKKRLTLAENNIDALLARAGEDEEFATSLEERLNVKRKRIEALEQHDTATNLRLSHLEKRAATSESALADHTLKLLNLQAEAGALRTWAVADEARIQDGALLLEALTNRVATLEGQVNKTAVKK